MYIKTRNSVVADKSRVALRKCNSVADADLTPTRVTTPNLDVRGLTIYAIVAENVHSWGSLEPDCLRMRALQIP